MTQDTQVRRLHARVLTKRTTPGILLNDDDFRFAADCERMRVDRNGSTLSLLLIRLPRAHSAPQDVAFMARLLEGRLRITDTPGLLNDGRIGVLLPDTPTEGAWKVATDLSEIYAPGPSRPECDVLVYPPHSRNRNDQPELEAEGEEEESAEVGVAEEQSAPTTSEFFFSSATPWWKRTIDVIGATIGLVIAAPVIAVAAAGIKLTSPGQAFFVQRREGLGGHSFAMWKLRTMTHGADELKEQLLALSQQDGPAFKMRKDPRTTPFGRLLRWTSIDELPQLWNVLRGEMSLVGPRPLPIAESQACEPWHRQRLNVTPGITCIWQVAGRGAVSFDDWVRMDLQYVRRRGLWEDVKLIVLTVPALLFHRGIR